MEEKVMSRQHIRSGLLVFVAFQLFFLSAVCGAQQTNLRALEDYTQKLQLSSGLSLLTSVYNGHNSNGQLIGDYDTATSFSDVSDRGFSVSWNMTYPANQSGRGFVPYAQQSHKVSIYGWSGGPPAGYCAWDRLSDAIYQDLKAGRETAFEFDGFKSDVSLKKVAEEDLAVLVNERKVRIHTLKGRTPKGWSVWVLDNSGFPIIVKINTDFVNWIVDSFSLPGASAASVVRQLQDKGVATTHNILFAFNSSELNDQSMPILNAVAEYLKANPGVGMEVQGHTDNVGGAAFNLKLSQARAQSVRKYLEQQGGIQSSRLTTIGFGLSKPMAPNSSPEGRALNRRVVFRELARQSHQARK
jgi:flagellar motor protein MotB